MSNNENKMTVLSLFDGLSGAQMALKKLGVVPKKYFASEIDKYAIKIAMKNFPNTIQLGDVTKWKSWNLPKINLLIGGSPCQDLSSANNNGKGLDGARSGLFWVYVDILNALPDCRTVSRIWARKTASNHAVAPSATASKLILSRIF